jgi:putative heme degradation protein
LDGHSDNRAACCAAQAIAARARLYPEGGFPRGLAALAGLGLPLLRLEAEAELLALVLPLFDRAAATTVGPHALAHQRGGYAAPRLLGRRRRFPGGRVVLALASGRGEQLILSPADVARRLPAALHLFDRDGALLHRTELCASADLLALEAVAADFGLPFQPRSAPTQPCLSAPPRLSEPPPDMIGTILAARRAWDGRCCDSHLDELALDGGCSRAALLPHLGRDRAQLLDPACLPGLLALLAQTAVPFGRHVLRPGCIQAQSGVVTQLLVAGRMRVLQGGPAMMALDLDGVARCWLTRWSDLGAVLELYDSTGQGIALLSGEVGSPAHHGDWLRLLERMERAR